MKALLALSLGLLVISCDGDGGDGDGKDTDQRILPAGAEFRGPVDGIERYAFDDGSRLEFVVSGEMVVALTSGVVLSAEFPAEVTFAVRSAAGQEFAGRAVFEAIAVDAQAQFRGETAVRGGTAVISGAFRTVSDATILDVQGFSFPRPVSATVKTHEIVLQGSRLAETRLTPAP